MTEIREILEQLHLNAVANITVPDEIDEAEAQIKALIKQAVDAQVKKDAEIARKHIPRVQLKEGI